MEIAKKVITMLLMVSMMPLCAMETKKNSVISDEELLAKKKAFALELKNRKNQISEFLHYPEDANIEVDEKALRKELGLDYGLCRFGNMFLISAGMDEKFIHKTLVPKRVPDFEIKMVI